MRTRRKWIAVAVAVAVVTGFVWFRYTNGQVLAPFLGWDRYRVSGDAMEPTMHDGDVFFCEPLDGSEVASLRVGALVVGVVDGREIVKRVVATAGDTVEGRDGDLLLNSTAEFADLTAQNELFDFDVVTVPDGHVFLVGDNFDGSMDSRAFGPIRYADVQCLVHR